MSDRNWWNDSYLGVPPWDIGKPQPAFVELERAGKITGSVIDIGCGTGETAIYLAQVGHEVVGVDGAHLAIERARDKAEALGVAVEFRVRNALDLSGLDRTFDSAVDSGLFHTFTDEERQRYAQNIEAVLGRGGKLFILCFSDLQPGTEGPRRVSEAEIRSTFSDGWHVESVRAAEFQTHTGGEPVRAWLAAIRRTD
jgi:cyclopropane fatty-acyl-phospholipid synthase-like methyltransferase